MSDEMKRACTTCVLCLRSDYGYSNYTCEGTELHCLAGLNPALEKQEDRSGESWDPITPELAEALDVALTCPRYRFGAPATLDVEREGIPWPVEKGQEVSAEIVKKAHYTDDDEAAELLAKWLVEP